MKIDTIQTNFSGGEFSPRLFGRTDIAQYANACAIVENLLVRPYGALLTTPGTEFINDAKYDEVASTATTLGLYVKFESNFSDSSTYNHSPLVTGATINNSFYAVGTGSGNFVRSATQSVSYLTHNIFDLSNNDFEIGCRFSVSSTTHNNMELNIISRGRPSMGASNYEGYRMGVFEDFGDGYKLYFFFSDDISGDISLFSPFFKPFAGSAPTMSVTMVANTFYNYKIVRSDGYIRFYLNGEEIPSGVNNDPSPEYGYYIGTNAIGHDASLPTILGAQINTALNGRESYFDGNIDELYLINGVPPSEYPLARNYGSSRLIPFVFARNDAYAIEAGEGYFRFYTDGAVVTA